MRKHVLDLKKQTMKFQTALRLTLRLDWKKLELTLLAMSQVRGCKYISFWKKRLSPAVGHAGYHLVLIFQGDFMILLHVFGRIGSILV